MTWLLQTYGLGSLTAVAAPSSASPTVFHQEVGGWHGVPAVRPRSSRCWPAEQTA